MKIVKTIGYMKSLVAKSRSFKDAKRKLANFISYLRNMKLFPKDMIDMFSEVAVAMLKNYNAIKSYKQPNVSKTNNTIDYAKSIVTKSETREEAGAKLLSFFSYIKNAKFLPKDYAGTLYSVSKVMLDHVDEMKNYQNSRIKKELPIAEKSKNESEGDTEINNG